MKATYVEPAILRFLSKADPSLYGRFNDLHSTVGEWLKYVPATFPNYTSHSVEHSDEIIRQVSQILFQTTDSPCSLPDFSAMEAYIFCCSALLHDAGMVASDEEKLQILSSQDWTDWITGSPDRARRWEAIESLRIQPTIKATARRAFEADIQTRFLLAEFIRRIHHTRAGTLITLHEAEFAHFAFDDSVLLQSIADVCVSHGLSNRDLTDPDRYPDRCDILSEPVNLRFIALLLRIGDLLDMSNDRACPLLLNAACPLPADSLAHWSQYRRIKRRLTAPDVIKVVASCDNQEEHRFLRDWLSWLTTEIEQATVLMARAQRHRGWVAPLATLDGEQPTLVVKPAATASYIPSEWRFELRPELVFERLGRDLYPHPLAFVRELLQNALDANRCKLYQDMREHGTPAPEYPTEVDPQIRETYPVKITLESRAIQDELSGGFEARQVFIIDDVGIGMSEDIIENYLLQVGRSYYTTSEFRRNFSFVPSSRFGIGFLSLFAVSERISIDTLRASPSAKSLRLQLTGPRNYLLLEKSSRRLPGTRVEVLLKERLGVGELAKALEDWCVRIELPVLLNDEGLVNEFRAQPLPGEQEWPLVNSTNRFVARCFPTDRHGIEGQLCVFAELQEDGEERWDRFDWSQYTYANTHATAAAPAFYEGYTCLQGIRIAADRKGGFVQQLDYRDDSTTGLSRDRFLGHPKDERILSRWAELFDEHLNKSSRAKAQDGWSYKQSLARVCPVASYWRELPGSIPFKKDGNEQPSSLNGALSLREFWTVTRLGHVESLVWSERLLTKEPPALLKAGMVYLTARDMQYLYDKHRSAIFSRVEPIHAELVDGWLLIHWQISESSSSTRISRPVLFASLASDEILALNVHKTTDSVYDSVLVNAMHPFACRLADLHKVDEDLWGRALEKIYDAVHFRQVKELNSFFDQLTELLMFSADFTLKRVGVEPSPAFLYCVVTPQ